MQQWRWRSKLSSVVRRVLFFWVVILSTPVNTLSAQAQIPAQYFGMSMSASRLYSAWPAVPFGSTRLWNTRTGWAQLNGAPLSYDWSILDMWLDAAQTHGVDVLYTFGQTPQWASSKPSDSICQYGPGECDPPNDLNADGTGTNLHWKNFVIALVTHAAGRIKYWELWNEPQGGVYWTGTFAQMVRLAKDARAIILSLDPNAILLSPGTGLQHKAVAWTTKYLAAGGGQYADVIAAHGYVNGYCPDTPPDPTVIPRRVSSFRQMLKTYGQAGKPLWITEGSWGESVPTCFTNQDAQAAFVAQFYLFYERSGVQRLYWYAWDTGMRGTLWNDTTLKPGIAYAQVASWLIGAKLSGCSATGTVWQCTLTRSGGYQALAVWDASKTCTANGCTTAAFTYPSQYVSYRDLDGNSAKLIGTTVQIGLKPILLEN
jgi:hypothetical protein